MHWMGGRDLVRGAKVGGGRGCWCRGCEDPLEMGSTVCTSHAPGT